MADPHESGTYISEFLHQHLHGVQRKEGPGDQRIVNPNAIALISLSHKNCPQSLVSPAIRRLLVQNTSAKFISHITMTLENKVAIVTGGSNGIGLAIVTSFVASGAKVAVLDIRTNDTFASQTNIHFINTNITSEDNVNSAIAEVVAKFGRVDILVNNAGQADNFGKLPCAIFKISAQRCTAKTADTPSDTWAKIFAVNVTGAFHLIKACIPIFQKQESKGCIINICSIASIRGSAAGAAYTMSKHALLGLSRSTSWGYRDEGIRCNAVVPGGECIFLPEESRRADQKKEFKQDLSNIREGWHRSILQGMRRWRRL